MNVQLVPGGTYLRMATEDLQVAQVSTPNDNSAWNVSLDERAPNNSALNTILRARYAPAESLNATCQIVLGSVRRFGLQIDLPQVAFDYQDSNWLFDSLPTAIEPKETFELLVRGSGDGISIDGTKDFSFPVDLATARTVYVMALIELYSNLRALWGITSRFKERGFHDFVRDSRAAAIDEWAGDTTEVDDDELEVGDLMAFAGDNFIPAAAMMLQDLVGKVPNIIADEVGASYQVHQLADSLSYVPLTLTIPISTLNAADANQTVPLVERCAPDGCLLYNDSMFGTFDTTNEIKPVVKAAVICGTSGSNCPRLLSSLGKRISGDEFNLLWSSTQHRFPKRAKQSTPRQQLPDRAL